MPARYARRNGCLLMMPPYKWSLTSGTEGRESALGKRSAAALAAASKAQSNHGTRTRGRSSRRSMSGQRSRRSSASFCNSSSGGTASRNFSRMAANSSAFSSPFRPSFLGVLHACSPSRCNFFRSTRTARNTRVLATPAEMPRACAMSA